MYIPNDPEHRFRSIGMTVRDRPEYAIGLKDKLPKVSIGKREKREWEQEAIFNLIFKMDRNGKNQSQISKYLNDEGIPTISGKGKWFPATVRKILRKAKGIT